VADGAWGASGPGGRARPRTGTHRPHLEPVWRLIPAASAAFVIVQPAQMRWTKSHRPLGVRRALAWAKRVPSFDCGFDTSSRTIGALTPSTTRLGTRASQARGSTVVGRCWLTWWESQPSQDLVNVGS
jgi:hypothetical protein